MLPIHQLAFKNQFTILSKSNQGPRGNTPKPKTASALIHKNFSLWNCKHLGCSTELIDNETLCLILLQVVCMCRPTWTTDQGTEFCLREEVFVVGRLRTLPGPCPPRHTYRANATSGKASTWANVCPEEKETCTQTCRLHFAHFSSWPDTRIFECIISAVISHLVSRVWEANGFWVLSFTEHSHPGFSCTWW